MSTQDAASLEAAITQYKSQVNLAINSATGSEHENLILLRSEIQELINLTQETLDSVIKQQESVSRDSDDPLAKEYALFKAELENDNHIETDVQKLESIEDDLKSLNGMKCQAPHKHQWGETCYHNALVCGTEPTSDISTMDEIQELESILSAVPLRISQQYYCFISSYANSVVRTARYQVTTLLPLDHVRVMFINPTHREMLPCPYFLDGECRFSDEKCHYSHGELVCLSALKEYRDPDFAVVQPGKGILAKSSDNLWYRAIVLSSPENNKCSVKFESSGKKCEVNLHDTIPLEDKDQTESAESGLSDESDQEVADVSLEEFLVQQSLMRSPPNLALGGWEKYTKGFGSRLMAQMGYITGTGLGKNGEGRIEPVEAVILPAGKSLDHCMELKEQAGGDEDLFKAEKRLKRLQKKEEQKQKQLAEREKNNKNIFDFINSKLGGKKGDISDLHVGGTDSRGKHQVSTKDLQSRSNKNLNLVGLQVDQEIKRAEQEIARMQESLVRHAEGSASYKRIAGQLQDKHDALKQLRLSENNINQESKRRKDHKKLTIF